MSLLRSAVAAYQSSLGGPLLGKSTAKFNGYLASQLPSGLGAFLQTLPEKLGPAEVPPGRNAETEEVREGISEGFHLVESGLVVLRDVKAVSLWLLDIGEFESTGSLEIRACD